jgi:hypothetical protein
VILNDSDENLIDIETWYILPKRPYDLLEQSFLLYFESHAK